jgi:nucleolar protein 58
VGSTVDKQPSFLALAQDASTIFTLRYGWHFPEMAKVVPDNLMYAKAIMKMGVRTQCKVVDFSDILPEEVETEMKEAAEISMGTEVSAEDTENILMLCDQVHRQQ